MSNQGNKAVQLLKLFGAAVVVLLIAIAIVMGYQSAGMPSWPFLLLLVMWLPAKGGNPFEFLPTAIGGLIGLVVGFVPAIVSLLVPGNAALPGLGLVVAILVFLCFNLAKNKYVEANAALFLTLVTSPSFASAASANMIVPTLLSYLIGVAVLGAAAFLMVRSAKKKAALAQ
ncbi:MAG: hypothetical protein AB2L09_10840 [Coriobacteriia bacterium]